MQEQEDVAIAEVAGRRHWREADARVLIDAWRQSGQTLTAFARAYEVHPERLARWHRLLRAESPEAVSVSSGASPDGRAGQRRIHWQDRARVG
jgi:hypothetical protein